MPKEYSRVLRVGEQIQRELATLIQFELKDPRVGMVTIADVEVTTDFAHARIYVSILNEMIAGENVDTKATINALNHASGYLRRELSRRLSLRNTPALRFYHDKTTENANRLSDLINRSVAEDTRRSASESADSENESPESNDGTS